MQISLTKGSSFAHRSLGDFGRLSSGADAWISGVGGRGAGAGAGGGTGTGAGAGVTTMGAGAGTGAGRLA